jgi:hypothetical protein
VSHTAGSIPEEEKMVRYWVGHVGKTDDFGDEIVDTFIDGKTLQGPWAMMTPKSAAMHGVGRLGTGYGQMYKLKNGKWLKVEG